MPFDKDVLISGAGAAGLTLAIDLARRGVSFMLIDQIAQPFGGSRGKGIQPRSQEVFEDLGILDRLAAIGSPYPPQREYRPDGSSSESTIMEHGLPSPAEPYAGPLMVAQFHTEAVMRERLAELGHKPQFGFRLVGFEQKEEKIIAQIANNDSEFEVSVRYLVGTDGGRSFVRQTLGIAFPGETFGIRALVADVHLEGLDRLAWHRFQYGTGATQVMICPLAGTDLFQIQAPVLLEGEVGLSPDALTGLLAERTGRSEIIVRSVSWASVYSMNARLADKYRVGRIFLAGDAAHIHPPTGGQGLNTSVQDTYNLGWKLAAVLDGAPDSLLDTYEEERRPIAAGVLGLSARLLDEAKKGPMTRGREAQQLDLNYRSSTLSLNDPRCEARVKAGDRAPDAPCRGHAGQPTRLFNIFQGPHWTLLAYRVDQRRASQKDLRVIHIGEKGDILDDKGHIAEAYGLSAGDHVLVRPDGYISSIILADRLEETLAKVFLGAPERFGAA